MKALKKIGIGLILLPLILIVIYILFELVGMCVNHISTDRQTDKLQSTLSAAVSDIDIINAESWTGNTGNGNHVECVSEVTFTSTMGVEDIAAAFYLPRRMYRDVHHKNKRQRRQHRVRAAQRACQTPLERRQKLGQRGLP